MSSWVPMDFKSNVLEMMAQSQGIVLPAEVINPPQPVSQQQPAAPVTAGSNSSSIRSSLPSKRSSLTNEQYLSAVDVSAGLVSTRKRLRPVSPVKQRDTAVKGEPDNDDDFLYGDSDCIAHTTATDPVNHKKSFSGSQYLDEPLDAGDDDDDDVRIIDDNPTDGCERFDNALNETEPGAQSQQFQAEHVPVTAAAAEPIPLLGNEDFIYPEEEESDEETDEKKKPAAAPASPPWQSDIPGLGSPIPDESYDPVVESFDEQFPDEQQTDDTNPDKEQNVANGQEPLEADDIPGLVSPIPYQYDDPVVESFAELAPESEPNAELITNEQQKSTNGPEPHEQKDDQISTNLPLKEKPISGVKAEVDGKADVPISFS